MRFVHSSLSLTLLSILLGATGLSARVPLAPAPAFSVVGFGDSLTIGATPASSYLSHLPTEWSAADRANLGELALSGQARLRAAIPQLVEQGVDVVVVMWGTQDAYAAGPETSGPSDWRDPLIAETAKSLDHLLAAGITPVVAFPPPTLDPSPQGVRANERLYDLEWLIAMEAMARDVAFVDLYAAILDEPDPSAYFADDGIHLNANGSAFAARQIERAVRPVYDAWLAERGRL